MLTWHRARLPDIPNGHTVAFRHGFEDYVAAALSGIGQGSDGDGPTVTEIAASQPKGDGVTLSLRLKTARRLHTVDLGQCLRGLRFAYRLRTAPSGHAPPDARNHPFDAVLSQPGLVAEPQGTHIVAAHGDELLALALLGKTYPENTILTDDADWPGIAGVGKSYGAKFVVQFAGTTAAS